LISQLTCPTWNHSCRYWIRHFLQNWHKIWCCHRPKILVLGLGFIPEQYLVPAATLVIFLHRVRRLSLHMNHCILTRYVRPHVYYLFVYGTGHQKMMVRWSEKHVAFWGGKNESVGYLFFLNLNFNFFLISQNSKSAVP
jgi:hypothetical protein